VPSDQLHDYWDGFYAARAADVPAGPSDFAAVMAARVPSTSAVAEFGFGTARDSFFFAGRGHRVHAYDFAESAVLRARGLAAAAGTGAEFNVLDLYDAPACTQVAALLASLDEVTIYGRFLLHSLQEVGRGNLFDLAATALADGGEMLLEFRTGLDADQSHLFGDDHYRDYLDPDSVVAEIERRAGTIVAREQGHGLAVYKSEDPHVARLVITFTR
jgi:hypothetical protein